MTFQTLEHPVRWLFLLHALAGAGALALLFIPLYTKKGGKIHIQTGWLYSYAMTFVGASALVLTPWRAFFDPNRTSESIAFAAFLFFIAVFTLISVAHGITVLKFKQRVAPLRAAKLIGPPILLAGLGIAVQGIGLALRDPLLMLFPLLGYRTAYTQLAYWLRPPTSKMHWWYAHMNGMITACIATITAFLVTALPRIWPDSSLNSPALWIAPGLILGTILNRWTVKYQKQFDGASA